MKCFVKYSKYCDFPIENLPYGVFSTENNVSNYDLIPMFLLKYTIIVLMNNMIVYQISEYISFYNQRNRSSGTDLTFSR